MVLRSALAIIHRQVRLALHCAAVCGLRLRCCNGMLHAATMVLQSRSPSATPLSALVPLPHLLTFACLHCEPAVKEESRNIRSSSPLSHPFQPLPAPGPVCGRAAVLSCPALCGVWCAFGHSGVVVGPLRPDRLSEPLEDGDVGQSSRPNLRPPIASQYLIARRGERGNRRHQAA